MSDNRQQVFIKPVQAEHIQIAIHALKREALTELWSEITTMSAVRDEDFVRILGCLIELAPHSTALARAAEVDVGALTAVASMSKSKGVIEIPPADRDAMLRRMYFEIVRQIGVLEQAA